MNDDIVGLLLYIVQIDQTLEIFPGDELCISCGEPWRPTEEGHGEDDEGDDEEDDEDEDDEEGGGSSDEDKKAKTKKADVDSSSKSTNVKESVVRELCDIFPQLPAEKIRATLARVNGVCTIDHHPSSQTLPLSCAACRVYWVYGYLTTCPFANINDGPPLLTGHGQSTWRTAGRVTCYNFN